jgi:hypothetical protein
METNMQTDNRPGRAIAQRRGAELALAAKLVDSAREYARDALVKRTRDAYARAWVGFEAWRADKGVQTLPAVPETVAIWITALADGEGGHKPLARSSIDQAFGAVSVPPRRRLRARSQAPGGQEGVAGYLQPEGQDAAQAPGPAAAGTRQDAAAGDSG